MALASSQAFCVLPRLIGICRTPFEQALHDQTGQQAHHGEIGNQRRELPRQRRQRRHPARPDIADDDTGIP